jgi:NADH dehydrogenase/NADH:ubiquinone oxidoreductase subunit G
VLCGRCTTACELVGSGAIAKINRGTTKSIDTPYDEPSPECIGCASCAHVCPTSSIPYEETETTVSIWGRTFELQRCEHCGQPISTDELIANASHKTNETPDALCAACRKLAVAEHMRLGYRQ